MNKNSQLRAYFALSWYALKASLRNKATLFFMIFFPVVLIGAFGLIGNSSTSVKIGLPSGTVDSPVISVVRKIPAIKTESKSMAVLEDELKKGKIDGILQVSPKGARGYSVTVLTSSANPSTAAAVSSIIKGIVDQLNLKLSGVTNPPVSFENKEISGKQFRYIDFILPGQIGFSLLNIALFSTVMGFLSLRKLLVLKRMFATPVKPMTILLSQGTSRLIMALLQTVIILSVGVFAFNFTLPHGFVTFLELIFLAILGLFSFMGFGLALSGLAADENSAGPLVQLVSLPQMLLSGVFFSTDNLPSWVQPIANNLPLSYFNMAVRKITTEGVNFSDTLPYIAGFMTWGIIMYLLATRTFKWE